VSADDDGNKVADLAGEGSGDLDFCFSRNCTDGAVKEEDDDDRANEDSSGTEIEGKEGCRCGVLDAEDAAEGDLDDDAEDTKNDELCAGLFIPKTEEEHGVDDDAGWLDFFPTFPIPYVLLLSPVLE
jgi:hypothetical protein